MRKKTKTKFNAKFLSLLLAFCMVIGMMPTVAFAAPPAPTFGGGTGDELDPYIISTEQHLIDLATAVNGGEDYLNKHFKQNANITVTDFVPIGWHDSDKDEAYYFRGTYDGDNNQINGTIGNKEKNSQALFGVIGRDYYKSTPAVIKNIINNATVSGNKYVGAIVGSGFYSEIKNCVNNGDVKGYDNMVGGIVGNSIVTIIENCYNTGVVTAEYVTNPLTGLSLGGFQVGGIVGRTNAPINNCYNNGTVVGEDHVGGIAGSTQRAINNCYNIGNVFGVYCIGGIVGENDNGGEVKNCFNKGNITGAGRLSTDNTYAGGIAGNNTRKIINCYNTGRIIGTGCDGGIAGLNDFGSMENCYNVGVSGGDCSFFGYELYECTFTNCYDDSDKRGDAEALSDVIGKTTVSMTTQNFVDDLNNGGTAFSLKAMSNNKIYYPYLTSFGEASAVLAKEYATFADLTGSGTVGSPYLIADEQDLIDLSEIVDSGEDCTGKFFKQTANITVTNFVPIGNITDKFKGTYDGDNHQIDGTIGNETELYQGLFGNVSEGGTIKNVANHATVKGKGYVGSIIGHSIGAIVENCYNTGDVIGETQEIGGIIGLKIGGSITDCYNTGDVTGSNEVGGIAGYNSGGSTTNCYSAGNVIGNTHVGGFTGNNMSTISNSYYDTDKCSKTSTPKGVTGKTTDVMATQTTVDALNNSGSSYSYKAASEGKIYYPYLTSFGADSAVVAKQVTTYTITPTAGSNGTISPSGAVTVADGGSQTFTFTPDAGYEIDTVTVDGTKVAVTGNSHTITNVTADMSINVTFKEIYVPTPPTVIEGDNQKMTVGSSNDIKFKIDADFVDFMRLEYNGATVDTANYTAVSGSIIITLKGDYVKTLAVGTHTFTAIVGNYNIPMNLIVEDVKEPETTPTYNVSYEDGVAGETIAVPTDANDYESSDKVTVSTTIPTRDGYTFKGWIDESVTTAPVTITDGKFDMPRRDVVLVAQWEEVEVPVDPTPDPTPDPDPTPTGDNSNAWLFIVLAVLSLGGISLTVFRRKTAK